MSIILVCAVIVLALIVFVLRNSVKKLSISVSNLRGEVASLSKALQELKRKTGPAPEPQPSMQTVSKPRTMPYSASQPARSSEPLPPSTTARSAESPGKEQGKDSVAPAPAKAAPVWPTAGPKKPAQPREPRKPLLAPGWEQRLAERWLVWLGGIAMALGGLFLVIYAADRGWLSPALRCIVGVLAGLALAGAGEWVRRRPKQLAIAALEADYVPQALSAAGLFVAFTSIYLAYGYFSILPAPVAFILLAAISFTGFGLSLLQGPYVAALGLIGAMLTPALVSTGSHSVWGLFGFLTAITVAVTGVLFYRKWWWLGFAAIALGFCWVLTWLVAEVLASDWPPICLFVFVVAAAFTWLSEQRTPKDLPDPISMEDWYSAQGTAEAAILAGMLSLAALATQTEYQAPVWVAIAVAAALTVALIYARPRFALLFAASAAVITGLMVTWPVGEPDLHAMLGGTDFLYGLETEARSVLSGERSRYIGWATVFSGLFLAGGYACFGKARYPLWVLVPSLVVPLALLLSSNVLFRFISDKWPFALAALLIAGLSVAAFWRLAPSVKQAHARLVTEVYSTSAVLFVTVALSFLFDKAIYSAALAILVFAISLIWHRVQSRLLWHFTLALATFVLIRLTFNPFILDYGVVDKFGQHWVLYGFGISAAAFYFAAQNFRRAADDELVAALESGALVFAVLLVTYEIRILIEGSIDARSYGLLEQSVQSLSWLTSAYGLSLRNARNPRFYTKWGARGLFAIATAQVLVLQVLANNPALTGDAIKGSFPADGLFLAYLAPAVLLCFIVPRLPAIGFEKIRGYAADFVTVLLLVYVTLEVRQLFQGKVIYLLHDSNLELYVTTLVWFALAAGLAFVKSFKLDEMLGPSAKWVAALATLMVFAGHIGVFNPVLTGLAVPGTVIFNVLLLGFAVPAIGFALIARRSEGTLLERYRDHLGIAAYAIGFAYVTLEVRRLFQGEFMHSGAVSDAEYYGYSLIWLVYALAALGLGMWLMRSVIRHAALAVLVLVVLKVFLSDMAGLGGLYRVASFMGLGLSLVGIGYLYQRYVFPVKDKTATAAD